MRDRSTTKFVVLFYTHVLKQTEIRLFRFWNHSNKISKRLFDWTSSTLRFVVIFFKFNSYMFFFFYNLHLHFIFFRSYIHVVFFFQKINKKFISTTFSSNFFYFCRIIYLYSYIAGDNATVMTKHRRGSIRLTKENRIKWNHSEVIPKRVVIWHFSAQ